MNNDRPSTNAGDMPLAPWLAEQVERDRDFLAGLADRLEQARAAMGAGKLESIEAVLRLQDEMARSADENRAQREQWRIDAASRFGMPADRVTYAGLAAALREPARSALLTTRNRLRAQAQEVTRLLAVNAFLARAYHGALERFFLDLTGARRVSGRYDREGACPSPAFGSILQAEG